MPYRKKILKPRKKVLSNKALTKQVRALKGTEGARYSTDGSGVKIYDGTAISAGTSSLKYFSTVSSALFTTADSAIHHYYDVYVRLVTTNSTGALVRLLYGFDLEGDTDGTSSQILGDDTQVTSGYAGASCKSLMEQNHKNSQIGARHVVVRDIPISLVANEIKMLKFRFPLFNKKTKTSEVGFQPWIMLTASHNITPVVQCNYVLTQLGA